MKAVNTEKKAALYEMGEFYSEPDVGVIPKKLAVSCDGERVFLDHRDIIFITREQRKTLIYTVNNREPIKTNEPLNSIFARLNTQAFFRSHKSYIININYVEAVEKWGSKSHQDRMKHTGEKALVSSKVLQELEERLS